MALPFALPFRNKQVRLTKSEIDKRYQVIGGGQYFGTANNGGGLDLGKAATEGYGPVQTVYRCVQGIASAASSLELAEERADEELVTDTPLCNIFNKTPHPDITAVELKLLWWTQLELAGQSFTALDRGPTGEGEVKSALPIPYPVSVLVDDRRSGTAQERLLPSVIGFRIHTDSGDVNLLPTEVLWLRYPHPSVPWGAMSPLRAAAWAVDLDNYARQWQAGELKNNARPSGVISLGDVSEEQATQIQAKLQALSSGSANAGRFIAVAGTDKGAFARIGLTPAEMSYIESRKQNREDIAEAFGYPMDLLTGQATYENRSAAMTELWSNIIPKLRIVESEIDRQLLSGADTQARFDIRGVEALQESEDALIDRTVKLATADIININEARERIKLDGVTGGDVMLSQFRGPLRVVEPFGERVVHTALEQRAVLEQRDDKALSAAEILRAYDRHERTLKRVVTSLGERQRKQVMRDLAKIERKANGATELRIQPDNLFDKSTWTEATKDALRFPLEGVYLDGATRTAKALGLSLDVFDERVLIAMNERLDVLSSQITDTTYKTIQRKLLQEGVAEGEGIPKLADRISEVFDELEGYRATTIARTESIGGFSSASRTAAIESGQVAHRTWRSTIDGRTRDSHAEMDGEETNGMEDAYSNGLLFPGDPSGDAGETINCRCYEEFILKDGSTEESMGAEDEAL